MPQIAGFEQLREPLADGHGTVLVEGAVVAEAVEVKLEAFRFHEPWAGNVVDDEDREIGLARDGTGGGEFRRRETGDVIGAG